jgi:hypothetical protein
MFGVKDHEMNFIRHPTKNKLVYSMVAALRRQKQVIENQIECLVIRMNKNFSCWH